MSALASEPSPSRPRALWISFEVADLDAATAFYTDHIGLTEVDGWDRDGERGVVLCAAEGAFVELVSPGAGHPPLIAFEQANESEVDEVHAGMAEAGPPSRYPRGHYGFAVDGPAGARVMVWSEK